MPSRTRIGVFIAFLVALGIWMAQARVAVPHVPASVPAPVGAAPAHAIA